MGATREQPTRDLIGELINKPPEDVPINREADRIRSLEIVEFLRERAKGIRDRLHRDAMLYAGVCEMNPDGRASYRLAQLAAADRFDEAADLISKD